MKQTKRETDGVPDWVNEVKESTFSNLGIISHVAYKNNRVVIKSRNGKKVGEIQKQDEFNIKVLTPYAQSYTVPDLTTGINFLVNPIRHNYRDTVSSARYLKEDADKTYFALKGADKKLAVPKSNWDCPYKRVLDYYTYSHQDGNKRVLVSESYDILGSGTIVNDSAISDKAKADNSNIVDTSNLPVDPVKTYQDSRHQYLQLQDRSNFTPNYPDEKLKYRRSDGNKTHYLPTPFTFFMVQPALVNTPLGELTQDKVLSYIEAKLAVSGSAKQRRGASKFASDGSYTIEIHNDQDNIVANYIADNEPVPAQSWAGRNYDEIKNRFQEVVVQTGLLDNKQSNLILGTHM